MSLIDKINADSPIAWWRFEEATGPWLDSVNAVPFVSPGGTTSRTTGPRGHYALRIVSAIDIATSGLNVQPGDQFTVEYWIKLTDVATAGGYFFQLGPGRDLGFYAVHEWGSGGSVRSAHIGLSSASLGEDVFDSSQIPADIFVPTAWVHVVYSYDNGVAKLYLNGVLVLVETHSGATLAPWGEFKLMDSSGFSVTTGEAEIYQLAIYDYILSAERVAAHFSPDEDPPPPDPNSTYKTLVLDDGPLIYLRYGEPEGTPTAYDSSGNNHHCSYHGNVQLQQTAIIVNDASMAAYFAGGLPGSSGAHVNVPIAPLQNLQAVSVESWFVWDDDEPNQRIFDFNNGTTGTNEGKYLFCSVYHHESGLIRAAVTLTGLSGDIIVEGPPIIRNRKYYVVVTLGNGALTIFVNGVKYGQALTDLRPLDLDIAHAWSGKSPWSVDTYFKGTKDETAVYDRVLTDEEILEHWTVGTDVTLPPSNIKNMVIDDHLIFNQTVTVFHEQAPGGGRVFHMFVSDTLSFGDNFSGPPYQRAVKDQLFFTDLTDYDQFPTRRIFVDQLAFVETFHGSPHRVSVLDTLVFTEKIRHNLYKFDIKDTLVFVEKPDPHWFEEPIFEFLNFDEIFWGQNNHQYHVDTINFAETVTGRFSIKNYGMVDTLQFVETVTFRWSIANLAITDTLVFTEEIHRILEVDVMDILVFEEYPIHVFPEDLVDILDFEETIEYEVSQGIIDVLTFVEVICVESSLTRGITDTLVFRQYVTFLINGPDDPRNGGGSPGNPNGPRFNAVYRRAVMDFLTFKETIGVEPEPTGEQCAVEIN